MYDRDHGASRIPMKEKYQTLHFPNNIDIRTMQRCGGTTMRHVWQFIHTGNYQKMGLAERYAEYRKHGVDGMGFRKGSYRITIIRPQMDRLVSVAAYRGYENINTVLENIEDYDDHHFDSYTDRLGLPEHYDKIYELDNIDKLVVSLGVKPYHTNQGNYEPVEISDAAIEACKRRYKADIENGWWT